MPQPRELVTIYLKGIAMGAADSVPGVSGGTIALITGIYERLVTAITDLDVGLIRLVGGLHEADARTRLRAELAALDTAFLVALVAGIATAILTISRLMETALGAYRALTFAFFFGLIAASAVVLAGELELRRWDARASGLVGVVVAFYVSGVTGGGALGHSLPILFVAGMIGFTAMILPGVSGSFLLLLLGQYEFIVGRLSTVVDGLLALPTGGGRAAIRQGLGPVVVFTVGGVLGLLTISHVIRYALATRRAATVAFLVGLMAGALRLPAVEVVDGLGTPTGLRVGALVLVGVVGAGTVLLLDHYTDDLSY
jgi:putative membrane protein